MSAKLYHNANGSFNPRYLFVKYPDFAAPVQCSQSGDDMAGLGMSCGGENPKSGRSSNFAGGGTSGQGLGGEVSSKGATGHSAVPSRWVASGLQAVASNSIHGRWT